MIAAEKQAPSGGGGGPSIWDPRTPGVLLVWWSQQNKKKCPSPGFDHQLSWSIMPLFSSSQVAYFTFTDDDKLKG